MWPNKQDHAAGGVAPVTSPAKPDAAPSLEHHHQVLHKIVGALKDFGIFTAEEAIEILSPGVPK